MPSEAEAQLLARGSVAQRLAGFEGEGDALLRFALAAEGEKCFALEVEKVLLADERAGSDAAAGKDVRGPASNFLVVFGGVAGFAHQKDARFKRGERGSAGSGDLRARLRRGVAGLGERSGLRLGVEQQALAVHGDAVGGREQAERARFGCGGGDFGHGDGFERALERGGQLGGLGEARRRIFGIGRRERGGSVEGAQQHFFGAAARGDQADAGFDEAHVGFSMGLAARGVQTDLRSAAEGEAEGRGDDGARAELDGRGHLLEVVDDAGQLVPLAFLRGEQELHEVGADGEVVAVAAR